MTTGYFVKYEYDKSFRQITWYDMHNLTRNYPRNIVIDDNVTYYCYTEYIVKIIRR